MARNSLSFLLGPLLIVSPSCTLAQAKNRNKPLIAEQSGASNRPISVLEQRVELNAGQTRLVPLPFAADRIMIADETIADVRTVSPTQFYVLGKRPGRTNMMVWQRGGEVFNVLVDVRIDVAPLVRALRATIPGETSVVISPISNSLVLRGSVSNTAASQIVERLARAWLSGAIPQDTRKSGTSAAENAQALPSSSGNRGLFVEATKEKQTTDPSLSKMSLATGNVINLLEVVEPSQVQLEVKIAEVAKTLTDRLGIKLAASGVGGNIQWNVGSNFLGAGASSGSLLFTSGVDRYAIDVDAEQKRGRIRILAQPTLVALSGTYSSFNVGGKILVPIWQGNGGSGGNSGGITLQEYEYGVGLKFRPTIETDGCITLDVAPEVSELSRETVTSATGQTSGQSVYLPTFTTSRVSTSVKLCDGQSLAIGGLLREASSATIKQVPMLGQIPILGALFRSRDYMNDKSELVIVVRPKLISASKGLPRLPTDAPPSASPEELRQESGSEAKR